MASSLQEQKEELILTLDAARQDMAGDFDDMATALDFPRQFRSSLLHDRPKWLIGVLVAGAAAGLIIAGNFRRRRGGDRPDRPPRGVLQGIMGFAGRGLISSLAQPAVIQFAVLELEKWFKRSSSKR